MNVVWHVLSAVPFAATGHWQAALGCVLPDVSLLATEWAIRRGAPVWRVLTPSRSPRSWAAYQLAHAPVVAAAVMAVAPWVGVGMLVHQALDWRAHLGAWRPNYRWPFRPVARGPAVVPLSGGYDSAACLLAAIGATPDVEAVFVEYGQPYLQQERDASAYMAHLFGVPLRVEVVDDMPIDATGKFDQRNERILDAAMRGTGAGREVYFGTRNVAPWFDRFGDSNPVWARAQSRRLGVPVHVPVAGWPKRAVVAALVSSGVVLRWLYSTEGYVPE